MKGPTNSSARPNIRLLNVSATFDDNPDTSNNTEFPYRASIQADGVSEYMSATVMFSQIQATSGNFATYCQTDEDVVYIYSKTDVGTITIPAVSCDLSVNYINVENVPTEDSQAVITSGGVYTNCVRTSGDQTIAGHKTFTDNSISHVVSSGNAIEFIKTQNMECGVTPSAWTQSGSRYYLDKNGKPLTAIETAYATNGVRSLYLRAQKSSTGTADNWGEPLAVNTDGTNDWASAPYRTSNLGNSDVLTKGNLLSAMPVTSSGWLTLKSPFTGAVNYAQYGKLVIVNIINLAGGVANTNDQIVVDTLPKSALNQNQHCVITGAGGTPTALAFVENNSTKLRININNASTFYGNVWYFCE